MGRYSRIHLGPARKNDPQVREAEAAASSTIKPGTFLVLSSGRFANAGASTVGKVWLAQENYLAQKGVDTAYKAYVSASERGDTVLGLELQDDTHYAAVIATGTNITAVGTPLKLASGGKLAIATPGTDNIVAFSDEIYNNNTGSDQLIRIRVSGTPGAQGPQGEAG
jgi:3D (Asp-Asp-Asp) domain-containing protein